MARDSRAEARKAWSWMRKRLSLSGFLAHEISALGKQIVPLLDVYGQEQYEAGYAAGHEDQMRARVLDAMEARQRASRPSPYDLDAIAADRARRRG